MTVLQFVFFIRQIKRNQHAVIRHIHSRHEPDGSDKKNKNHQIFTPFSEQLFGDPFYQRVCDFSLFHSGHLLPVKIHCGYFFGIDVVMTYHTVTKFNNMIRHVADGFVMRYHDDGIAVFFIHLFDEF